MAKDNKINITVQAKDLASKILKGVGKSFSNLEKSLRKNTANFKKMAGFGGAAFTGIGLGIKNLVDQASDLEETTQKFGVVYRDLADEANKSAKVIAEGYGLSQMASKKFLADLGDITSGFGMSQKASLEYAKEVTKLGVDLTSFANIAGGSEEAIDRLNKGFLGEHENLKALGIIINDTMLKKQLLADGTSKLTGLELEQAKIQARMTIAISQSANAIGDFERSKGSLANQTRILQANMEDMTTELGQAFLPIITSVTSALVPIVQNLANWAKENPKLIKTIGLITLAIAGTIAVLGTLGLILPTILTGFGLLTTAVGGLGTALVFLTTNPIGLVITGIAALIAIGVLLYKNWDTVVEFSKKVGKNILILMEKFGFLFGPIGAIIQIGVLLYKNWDLIIEKAGELANLVSAYFSEMGNNINTTVNNILSGVTNVWNNLKNITSNIFNGIKNDVIRKFEGILTFVRNTVNTIKSLWSSVTGGGGDNGGGIDGARADGGPVKRGGTYLVGERGPELFTPLNSGSIISNEKLNKKEEKDQLVNKRGPELFTPLNSGKSLSQNLKKSGSNKTVNINLGGVVINNEADENSLIEKIKEVIYEEFYLAKSY